MTVEVRDVLDRADLHSLVLVDTELRRVGKELHGPCPFCICASDGHKHQCDRFRLDANRRHWFCRHCTPNGGDAISYAMKRYDVPFKQACYIACGGQRPPLAPQVRHRTNAGPTLPSKTWQDRGRELVQDAIDSLWSPVGTRALEYLHARGLSGRTIRDWQLGYIARGDKLAAADWGLPPGKEIYLQRGILIPWFTSNGALTGLKIRKPVPTTERNKYASITGSVYRLYGTPTVVIDQPLVLVEGEFDAIAAWQALGDQAATVALGTARVPDAAELRLLCAARPVLVALDADEKGDQVAGQILSLSENCRRARPDGGKDLASCLQDRTDLRSWFRTALEVDA